VKFKNKFSEHLAGFGGLGKVDFQRLDVNLPVFLMMRYEFFPAKHQCSFCISEARSTVKLPQKPIEAIQLLKNHFLN